MRLKPFSSNWLRSKPIRIAFIAACGVAVLVAVIWLLPIALTHTHGSLSAKDVLDARNSVRVTLLQTLGALFLAAGLVYTERNFRLNREGHVTDRYSKAVEQLGNASVDVRLGGIYALERIARDSRVDYATITELICAFIHEHTSEPSDRYRSPLRTPAGADIQAAATVLARRRAEGERIDLSHSGLNNLRMSGQWHGAQFNYCRITDSIFARSEMESVSFSFSHIKVGGFNHIKARGAHFVRSTVQAWFVNADLRDADFYACDLTGTDFSGRYDDEDGLRHLRSRPAQLAGARFTKANLTDVNFTGVDLSEVRGLTRSQLDQAIVDADTILPSVFEPDPSPEINPETPVSPAPLP